MHYSLYVPFSEGSPELAAMEGTGAKNCINNQLQMSNIIQLTCKDRQKMRKNILLDIMFVVMESEG